MKVPFLDLKWQHAQVGTAIKTRFDHVFENTSFTLGEDVKLFEDNFARFIGVNHVVGVDNGTDALAIAYHALGIGAGDEIITIPTTFIATIAPAIQLGIKPVFVDIDAATRNFDFSKLEAAVTSRTKAIVPVHLYGDMPDMDKILAFAKAHDLFVIEDAAQAQGARFKGKCAGSFGELATFSFYPGKNLGAYGQAGAIAQATPKWIRFCANCVLRERSRNINMKLSAGIRVSIRCRRSSLMRSSKTQRMERDEGRYCTTI